MNTILIMDSDRGIRLLLCEELGQEGYDVVTCSDESQPRDIIEQFEPDLIVMDIRVGRDNGLDLLRDIRNRYANLPIILYTAYPSVINEVETVAVDYFVTKGLDLEELKSTVKAALKGIPQLQRYREKPVNDQAKPSPHKQMGFGFGEKG